jgi:hypothetical protein
MASVGVCSRAAASAAALELAHAAQLVFGLPELLAHARIAEERDLALEHRAPAVEVLVHLAELTRLLEDGDAIGELVLRDERLAPLLVEVAVGIGVEHAGRDLGARTPHSSPRRDSAGARGNSR